MAAIEYDMDLSGGLMEEIQLLTQPPQNEEIVKKKKVKEKDVGLPVYRRGGKTVNREFCNSCKEGGDLLCCDRCPAAFHLECHDPPLEESDVSPGEWVCHRCRSRPQEDDDSASTCSSRSRQSEQSNQTRKSKASLRDINDAMDVELAFEEEALLATTSSRRSHPLQVLAKAARYMNPRQFELPKDVICPIVLPGSSKRRWTGREERIERRGAPRKQPSQPHELENGLVQLPAKTCFACCRSCRVGSLIQCDYCPLLFHLDCLDPPLTTMPGCRWMCPNHVQCALEDTLKSTKLTERVKLWDQYCQTPVEQHSIKVNFLKKIHRRNPPFRIKVRHKRKVLAKVPNAIKAQYTLRPPLLPQLNQPAACLSKFNSESEVTTFEEQEQWLNSVMSLQSSVVNFLQEKRQQKQTSEEDGGEVVKNSVTAKPTASVLPVVKQECPPKDGDTPTAETLPNGSYLSSSDEVVSLTNGPLVSEQPEGSDSILTDQHKIDCIKSCEKNNEKIQKNCMSTNGTLSDSSSLEDKGAECSVIGSPNVGTCQTTASVSQEHSGVVSNSQRPVIPMDTSSSGAVSSAQRTVKPMDTSPSVSVSSKSFTGVRDISSLRTSSSTSTCSQGRGNTHLHRSSDGSSATLNLQSSAAVDSADIDMSKLDERLMQLLARQRLHQLLSEPQLLPAMDPKTSVHATPISTTQPEQKTGPSAVRARAVLCPLSGNGSPVQMPYRSFNIGTGSDMDVCLNWFGHCNYVSSKHACIFYDETSRQFELLNYSEHGTTVDNVLYSCDFSEKATPAPKVSPVVANVRKVIAKAKAKQDAEKEAEKARMNSHAARVQQSCGCRASSSSLIGGSGAGWEGTALLHHGSYVKLGCLPFIFSIVQSTPNNPLHLNYIKTALSKTVKTKPEQYS